MSQYEQFLTKENFKLAFLRLKTASRNLYKTIYYEDLKLFELFLDDNIYILIKNIQNGIYKPKKCHKIFIPKKDNFIRPLSMLYFIDLLVYQAIVNIIADTAYDKIYPYYNKIIFGNIINTSKSSENDKNFFYKPWKRKWKRFNEISKENFSKGYIFLSEFDIASFFDTIDHNILCEILENIFCVEKELLQLLSKCLEVWTENSNIKSFKSKHGIPQGPSCSHFLADLYLFHIDSEMRNNYEKLDFKYIRYVDDIRIFSKDSETSKKLISELDLISRDLGLIPQGSKILTKEITNIDNELKIQKLKFSEISKEYKSENENKKARKIKSKTQKKLKKIFLDCFDKNLKDTYLDKTIISFLLYKLNSDDEIKKVLINNYKLIITHFEGVLFYLKTHYEKDNEVIKFIGSIISDENILFNHLIALCFKCFSEYPFDEKVYRKFTSNKHRDWLVNYYMIYWLFKNNKKELVARKMPSENYFIQREINKYNYLYSKDSNYKKILIEDLLDNNDPMLSLQGINLLFENNFNGFTTNNKQNEYINYIFRRQESDFIIHILKNEWEINNPEIFFNKSIWNDESEYNELICSFTVFTRTVDNDPSKSLLNLNSFNNLLFDKICIDKSISKVAKEYGVNLNANIIENILPICNKYWTEINEKRNQKTEAHPYDKDGKIRLRITSTQFSKLFIKQKETIKELCIYYNQPM